MAVNVELQWRKLKQLLGRTQIAKVFHSAIFNTKASKIPANNLTISLRTDRQTDRQAKKKSEGKAPAPQVNLQTEGKYDFSLVFLLGLCLFLFANCRLLILKIQIVGESRRAYKGFWLPKVVGLQLFGQTCDPNPFDGPHTSYKL